MQRSVSGYLKIILLFSIMIAACYILAVKGSLISHVVFHFPNISTDNRNMPLDTSMEYRYEKEFRSTLKKYSRFNKLYQEEISTPIPGLEYTKLDGIISSQMVPQGICIAGDYMLVTAYDNGKNVMKGLNGSQMMTVNHSVIYVLSNTEPENRVFLTTIVLPDVNHVGGIAFDGKYVWIAKSTTKKCSAIDYHIIEGAVASGENSYVLETYTTETYCGVTASFLTYHDGMLWVGTFRSRISGRGTLQSFEIKKDGRKLIPKEKIMIPAYANGVAFTKTGSRTCMAVVSSYGRYGDSKIYLYEVVKENKKKNYVYQGVYAFPPMAEELVCDGENTYFLFESAATCYSTAQYNKCSYPVDRICGVSTDELFYWARDIRFHNVKSDLGRYVFQIAYDYAYLDPEKYMRILAMVGVQS